METSEVAKLFKDALAAVEEAKVPEPLRTTAFSIAVDLLRGRGATPPEAPATPSPPPATETGDSEDPARKLAASLRLPIEVIEDVFDFSGGEFSLHVPTSRLTGTKKETTQQLSLLCVAGRLGSGLDATATPTSAIREVGQHYANKFDSTNFAVHVREQDDEFRFSGPPRKMTVKLTKLGHENARELVERLANPSE